MITLTLIGAGWMACSVAGYLVSRNWERRQYCEWTATDRTLHVAFSALLGPFWLACGVVLHAMVVTVWFVFWAINYWRRVKPHIFSDRPAKW